MAKITTRLDGISFVTICGSFTELMRGTGNHQRMLFDLYCYLELLKTKICKKNDLAAFYFRAISYFYVENEYFIGFLLLSFQICLSKSGQDLVKICMCCGFRGFF